jgi:membrane fusion protein, multidrug efflux system
MRAVLSYGIAGLLVLGVAAWLSTGTLVIGGKGAGNGERPMISLIEEDPGPITATFEESGLMAEQPPLAEGAPNPHLTIAERIAASSGEAGPAQAVRTQNFSVREMPVEVPLRGRTKAKTSVTVQPETQGIVTAVHVEKGDTVAPGDLLCTLDRGTREVAVAQAEAALAQAEEDLETNLQLRERGLAPANSGRALEVALRSAQQALENAQAELARTEIHSQVGGVVQEPLATVGSMLTAGTPCATVVQLDPMLFTGSVSEADVGLARLGLPATIRTVTGQTVEGKVSFIASTADPATRSFTIEIELPNPDRMLLAGITAEATIRVGTTSAHLLPQSVLTLDDEGTLGLRAVSEDGTVDFHAVDILRDTREGVWVKGLPRTLDVIIVGQEFVVEGQTVKATSGELGATS